jgi:hypothetical protein
MRNRQPPPSTIGPFRPQQYIQIDHPRAPAATAPSSKSSLYRLDPIEQYGRIKAGLDHHGCIGETAPSRPECGSRDDRRHRRNPDVATIERGNSGAHDGGGRTMAPMSAVRAEPDRVEIGPHANGYSGATSPHQPRLWPVYPSRQMRDPVCGRLVCGRLTGDASGQSCFGDDARYRSARLVGARFHHSWRHDSDIWQETHNMLYVARRKPLRRHHATFGSISENIAFSASDGRERA